MIASTAGSSTPGNNQHHHLTRIPNNARGVGLFLGRSHEPNVPGLIRITPNEDAVAMLAAWRRSEQFQFVLIVGELWKRRGATLGGMCRTWNDAKVMFCYAGFRFDEIASTRGMDFVTVWRYHLEPEQIAEVSAIVAESMQTAGSA